MISVDIFVESVMVMLEDSLFVLRVMTSNIVWDVVEEWMIVATVVLESPIGEDS